MHYLLLNGNFGLLPHHKVGSYTCQDVIEVLKTQTDLYHATTKVKADSFNIPEM